MANHKSALKRIKQTETRRLLNKQKHKTARNAVRDLKANTNKIVVKIIFPLSRLVAFVTNSVLEYL